MTTASKISPADHGLRMSLADFDHAEVQEGYRYELGRGVIVVSEMPKPPHLLQIHAMRRQLAAYDIAQPGRIHSIGGGGECKILLADLESERHPDLAVYKTAPPAADEEVWAMWVPEIVVEIVSADSEQRDYGDKREEYLRFGVQEYWIVDARREQVLVLRRSGGRWAERVLGANDVYRTRQLPGFELACGPVFEAARAAGG
jgi:Uma2 family endonuclease